MATTILPFFICTASPSASPEAKLSFFRNSVYPEHVPTMSQKALVLEKIGQPAVIIERPIPEPNENEVLVKVAVAGINPHDGYSKAMGLFVEKTLPTPFAVDIVGEVVKLGPKVTKFQIGDTVFGFGDPQNPSQLGTQEYCCLDVDQAAKKLSNVSLDEAATFPLNPMTSYFAMFSIQGLNLPFPWPGKDETVDNSGVTLVIIGAGAATGKFALQLAKLAGIGQVIAIASKSNESQLKSLGATHVIDRHQSLDEIDKEVRAIVGDDLTMVYDCIGGANGGQTLGAKLLSNSKRGMLAVLVLAGTVDESNMDRSVQVTTESSSSVRRRCSRTYRCHFGTSCRHGSRRTICRRRPGKSLMGWTRRRSTICSMGMSNTGRINSSRMYISEPRDAFPKVCHELLDHQCDSSTV